MENEKVEHLIRSQIESTKRGSGPGPGKVIEVTIVAELNLKDFKLLIELAEESRDSENQHTDTIDLVRKNIAEIIEVWCAEKRLPYIQQSPQGPDRRGPQARVGRPLNNSKKTLDRVGDLMLHSQLKGRVQ